MNEIIEAAQAVYYHGRAIKQGVITAALIIAIAMLGCAVIEYMAFTADGEEPSSIEQEAGPATLDIQRISLMRL